MRHFVPESILYFWTHPREPFDLNFHRSWMKLFQSHLKGRLSGKMDLSASFFLSFVLRFVSLSSWRTLRVEVPLTMCSSPCDRSLKNESIFLFMRPVFKHHHYDPDCRCFSDLVFLLLKWITSITIRLRIRHQFQLHFPARMRTFPQFLVIWDVS